jgi:hypothetical protein
VSAAGGTVGLFGRDDELTPAADLHPGDAVLPALDQPAQRELDRFAAIPRAVELLAGVEFDSDIVHLDGAAGYRLCPVADYEVADDQPGGRGPVRKFDFGFLP